MQSPEDCMQIKVREFKNRERGLTVDNPLTVVLISQKT
jgi:hypothetical protein